MLSLLALYGIYISKENLNYQEKPELLTLNKNNQIDDKQTKNNLPTSNIARIFNLDRNNIFNFYLSIFIIELAYKIATR